MNFKWERGKWWSSKESTWYTQIRIEIFVKFFYSLSHFSSLCLLINIPLENFYRFYVVVAFWNACQAITIGLDFSISSVFFRLCLIIHNISFFLWIIYANEECSSCEIHVIFIHFDSWFHILCIYVFSITIFVFTISHAQQENWRM